jgi:hypothetical protein
MVAVVGATGTAGMVTANFLPYFISGVGYPDWTIVDSSVLTSGATGIRACGFFDERWEFDPGQSAVRE